MTLELVRFINRTVELEKLARYAEKGYYPVFFLYGPEGCGKTRLLMEFIKAIKVKEDYIVIYVDAQDTHSIRSCLYGTEDIVSLIPTIVGVVSEPAGRAVAKILPYIVERYFERRILGKHVIIALDDVARPLGLEIIESYIKKLLDFLEWLISKGAKSAFIIATSEGKSRRLLARHNYVTLHELWNLDPNSTRILLNELNCPQSMLENIWFLTGGNPRAIIELALKNWDIEEWLSNIKVRIRASLEKALGKFKVELENILEDIDSVLDNPKILEMLLDANLIAPVDRPCLGYTPPIDHKLGVGEYYAWQIPAYREVLKQLLKAS